MKSSIFNKFFSDYKRIIKILEMEGLSKGESVMFFNQVLILFFLEKNNIYFKDKNYLEIKLNFYENYYNDFLKRVIYIFLEKNTDIKMLSVLEFNISKETIKKVYKLMNKYNYSLNIEQSLNEISPIVLMNIFEKIINQKEKGAYYTPKATTYYIVEKSLYMTLFNSIFDIKDLRIISNILENFKENLFEGYNFYKQEIDCYINNNNFNLSDLIKYNVNLSNLFKYYLLIVDDNKKLNLIKKKIFELKVLDPTCGSGAFLLEVLNEVINLKESILKKLNINKNNYELYMETISENIFGIDLMPGALEILKIQLYLNSFTYRKNNEKRNFKFNLINKDFLSFEIKDFKNKELIGFDCIVGNPPYIEKRFLSLDYSKNNLKSYKCGNIYAYIMERSLKFLKNNCKLGMIVPMSIVSTKRMKDLREILEKNSSYIFYSNYADRPSCLFKGVHQKLSIVLLNKEKINGEIYSSKYNHWNSLEEKNLFNKISYIKIESEFRGSEFIPKIGNNIEKSIYKKIRSKKVSILENFKETGSPIYLTSRLCFWNKSFIKEMTSSEYKKYYLNTKDNAKVINAVLNSNLFFMFWEIVSDGWHITKKELIEFKFSLENLNESLRNRLASINDELEKDLEKNKKYVDTKQTDFEYKHKYSKDIINKIDFELSKYYLLTRKELEYILNYNLKYRMGEK